MKSLVDEVLDVSEKRFVQYSVMFFAGSEKCYSSSLNSTVWTSQMEKKVSPNMEILSRNSFYIV